MITETCSGVAVRCSVSRSVFRSGRSGRAKWLAKRREMITASDWAAILGFDPRRSALDVFVSKKTGAELEDNDALLLGRVMEPGISAAYVQKTGRHVFDPGDYTIFQHPDIPWLGATLDRVTWQLDDDWENLPGAPLELKHAGSQKRCEWKEGCPLWVEIQLQGQTACYSSTWGAYCGVIGGQSIHLGDIGRNDAFIESTIPVLEAFRKRLADNDPPPPTSPKDLDAIKALYALDNGDSVPLDGDALELVNAWEAAKLSVKEVTGRKEELEAKIRATLGEATFGLLNDGTMVTLKTTKNKGYTKTVQPFEYRTLRRVEI